MENFRRYNLILGWGVFLVSLIVYLLTMEPTASFLGLWRIYCNRL